MDEASQNAGSRWPPMFRALRHRNYRLFFSGQIISLVGTWMQSVAQSWLVYRLTGSSLLLGLVGFAGQIPVFILAPLGGLVADRYSRHRIVIFTQSSAMLLAFVLSALTLLEHIQVWQVMVLAALLGVVNAFDIPARQSFIVEMVKSEDMLNAIALNSSMVNGARILGPAIAGVTVAAIGEGWCFFANGASYIAVLAGLLLMVVTPRERTPRGVSGFQEIVDGFRWVARTGPIRALLLLLGVVSVTGMPYAVLMPIFADQILHGGARGLGWLMGASGRRRTGRNSDARGEAGSPRPGQMDHVCLRRFWGQHDSLRDVAVVPALHCAADAGWILHDDPNGLVEHAHPNHVPRRVARPGHGRLLDDVHGDGALWLAYRRSPRQPFGRPHNRYAGWSNLPAGGAGFCIKMAGHARRGASTHPGARNVERRAARGDDGTTSGDPGERPTCHQVACATSLARARTDRGAADKLSVDSWRASVIDYNEIVNYEW